MFATAFNYTCHITNTTSYTMLLVAHLAKQHAQITPLFKTAIEIAALWHDIGKQFLPEEILSSSNKLTDDEFTLIKTHTTLGKEYIDTLSLDIDEQTYQILSDVILYHHEKFDGSGYPMGIAANEIPLSAKIVALADVFEALTSKRSYKPAFSFEKAKHIIVEGKGTHFDPVVVEAFLSIQEQFKAHLKSLNCGQCAA
ncbi:HD domain-containing protein [Vibrio sp. S11_S32]|uniref:HD-GYP domain-containing protein n=1 Tax=Vibrio sp. S11_S32 TaxID=2720225 RepID=UPI001680F556|nr:HD domain-containing phosphohydrolase [Vibrio sp. S11_S32]MBD1576993.1 HD domain-containing protein [Vibrio sp. S11_S32]